MQLLFLVHGSHNLASHVAIGLPRAWELDYLEELINAIERAMFAAYPPAFPL